jgi:hypothetical protein
MKSLLNIVIMFALALPTVAQSLEFTEYDIELGIEEVLDYNVIIATNTSAQTKTYAMRLEKRCYNGDDGLNMQICWGALCYPPTNDDLTVYENEIVLVTLGPGESTGEFSIHQFFVEDYGSQWRLYFYDLNDPSDETYLDIHVGDCLEEDMVISVNEIAASADFGLFPNPASTNVQVQIPEWTSGLHLTIRDLSGRIVEQINITDSQQTVDVTGLKDGIYLVRLLHEGATLSTKRLVVK